MCAPTPYRGPAASRISLPLVLSVIAGVLLLLALLVLLVFRPWSRAAAADSPPPESGQPVPTGVQPSPSADPAPADSAPSVAVSPSPAPSETPKLDPDQAYDFTQPVPQSEAAADSYFDDAVFVGDSRTAGFMLYSGVPAGDSLTHTGLTVFDIQKDKQCIPVGGKDYSTLDALALKDYGKIYLCVGVNELGYPSDEKFYEALCQVVDSIRQVQPGAVLYLETLIPLNEQVIAQTGGKDYLKNDHLRAYNELIRQVGAEYQVPVLDVYSAFADESGSLAAEASNDGVHLNKSYCQQWLDYIRTHTVDYDTLYPEGDNAT